MRWIEANPLGINCLDHCKAACCQGIVFSYMTDTQANHMEQAGGDLVRLGADWYLKNTCPYNDPETHECTEHENPELRPDDCALLIPGCETCLKFREHNHIEPIPGELELRGELAL